jgi:predicted PurR-regulated permease PerM
MNPEEILNHNLKKMLLMLGWMLILAGGIWAITLIWPALVWLLQTLAPFLIAFVVAYVFNPVVRFIQRKLRCGRVGGILMLALIGAAIIFILLGIIIPLLYTQIANAVNAIQTGLPALIDRLPQLTEKLPQQFQIQSLDELRVKAIKLLQDLNIEASDAAKGGSFAKAALARFAHFIGGMFGLVALLGLVLVISFYILIDFEKLPHIVRTILPHHIRARTLEILGKVDATAGGFMRGQMIDIAIVASLATIGLAAIGMWKYALLIGVLTGIANMIPYLGPIVGTTPALAWAFFDASHDTWTKKFVYAGLCIGVFVSVQMIDNFILQPRIVGKSANLHPLMVIAALIVGSQFGLAALILAVPSAAILQVLFKELFWDRYWSNQEDFIHMGESD